jgi:hypothetical protein
MAWLKKIITMPVLVVLAVVHIVLIYIATRGKVRPRRLWR